MDRESNKNPELVTNAIIDSGKVESKKDEHTVKVYPMTIRRYALLEKIGSPFVGASTEFTVDAIVPTAYVMCTSKEKLREYAASDAKILIEAAFDWSEELEVSDLPALVENITKQMNDMNKAAPDPAPASNMTKKN